MATWRRPSRRVSSTRASSTAATSSPARRITTSWKPALRSSGRVHCTARVRSPPRPTWWSSPYQIESVIKPIADEFAKNGRFVVSIAAGWDLAKYQKLFGDLAQSIHIQCTIPNTPMAVGKGVLVTETDNTLTDMQTEVFELLFGPISLIERVDTAHMTIAMVVAGCAPAFTDMYIEALGDAGVQYGLQRATAYRLAAKMVEGVGALYMATGTHPGAMKDAVCSPGGTTIRGVAKLEKDGFRGAVIDAVDAIVG